MDIKKYLIPGKDIVIDIEEVEYVFDDEAIEVFERGNELIPLKELYDQKRYLFLRSVVTHALKHSIIDYLDKR